MNGRDYLNSLIAEKRKQSERRRENERARRAAQKEKLTRFDKQREQKRAGDARYRANCECRLIEIC